MFGYFYFGEPMFADVPVFATDSSGGAGGGKRKKHPLDRTAQATQIEAILMAFLNTQ